MASCAVTSSTRLVVNSSLRARKTRTSSVNGLSGSSGSNPCDNVRYISSNGYRSAVSDFSGFATSTRRTSIATRLLKPSSSSNSTVARRGVSSSSIATASAVMQQHQQQHQQQWQEQDKWNIVSALLLSSAFATLGFATATTSSPGAGSVSTGKTATTAKATFGRGGGGPGSNKPFSSTYTASSRENAEEDVRRLELAANEQPYMVSVGALQGARWTMEDEYKIANGGRFAAVFDGHGGNGVSRALRERLFDAYGDLLCRKHWEELDETANRGSRTPSISSHVSALRGAFAHVNDEVMAQNSLENQGSTAVAVVTHISENGHRTLLSANVGDSRAILSRKGRAMELTRDHKPNDERERERIMALGEVVEWDSYSQVHRVRSLSLSRAIGDKFAGPAVSADADIRHFPVDDDDDEFILLASDGLWDVMSSQEVVDFVHECMNEGPAHKALSKDERDTLKFVQARSMGRIVANEAIERGSPDNVCVLVVWLGDRSIKN